MMKIKIWILGAVASLSLTACNSLFDDAPLDKISDEATWTNTQLVDEYANTWYREMSSGFSIYGSMPATETF